MIVYIFALFMTVIDGTMVNVALPTMARDFGVPTTDIEWISLGYLLALAAVIPAAGWLGDRFGTKRIFVIADDPFRAEPITEPSRRRDHRCECEEVPIVIHSMSVVGTPNSSCHRRERDVDHRAPSMTVMNRAKM